LPSITVFGTRFPPTFAYPSHCDRYKPLSMCSLQTAFVFSGAGPAVADGLGAMAAIRLAKAHANRKQPVVLLKYFVFMIVFQFVFVCFLLCEQAFRSRFTLRKEGKMIL